MQTKVCFKCKQEKDVSFFHKNKSTRDGYAWDCRDCRKNYNYNHRNNNKEYFIEYNKEYNKNREGKKSAYNKLYREKNSDKVKKAIDSWRTRHKKEERVYQIAYIKNNIDVRIACRFRIRIATALKKRCKYCSSKELLGCDYDFLRKYLESLWTNGMSWDNYAKNGWHIDHIRPCASFDLTNPEEQKKCFHYTNLQPLWWQDNYIKGSSFDGKRYYKKRAREENSKNKS